MRRYQREVSVALAYLLLLGLLGIVAPGFYRGDKLWSILVTSAPVLVAGLGMTLIILLRQIDISIGSQFTVCAIVAGMASEAGLPIPVVAVIACACGALLGAVNGAFVAGLRLPSIVVTLATMFAYRETLRWYRQGEAVINVEPDFQWFGLSQLTGQILIVGIACGLSLVFGWALSQVAAGRMVYATGSDLEAARLAGMRPQRLTFAVFVLMGLLTGLAALLNAVRFPQVESDTGKSLELQVIAAVVVGGTAITGGRGRVWGTLIGVLLLATIGPALVFFGVAAHWEKALQGAIILLAVASDALQGQRRPAV